MANTVQLLQVDRDRCISVELFVSRDPFSNDLLSVVLDQDLEQVPDVLESQDVLGGRGIVYRYVVAACVVL